MSISRRTSACTSGAARIISVKRRRASSSLSCQMAIKRPSPKAAAALELADAIVDPSNPLTSRVAVNRIWATISAVPWWPLRGNFGKLGETPSHPELLDYLAARLIELNWSVKTPHREIMLSNAYALSARSVEPNGKMDPDNKLVWRANRRRLDVEPMRDTLLFASGELYEAPGGPAAELNDVCNVRRTVYGSVSRRRLDGTLALFDFPNPVATSEGRIQTATPLQQLFFLNSDFIRERARAFSACARKASESDRSRIRVAYRLLFQREPPGSEVELGLEYSRQARRPGPVIHKPY